MTMILKRSDAEIRDWCSKGFTQNQSVDWQTAGTARNRLYEHLEYLTSPCGPLSSEFRLSAEDTAKVGQVLQNIASFSSRENRENREHSCHLKPIASLQFISNELSQLPNASKECEVHMPTVKTIITFFENYKQTIQEELAKVQQRPVAPRNERLLPSIALYPPIDKIVEAPVEDLASQFEDLVVADQPPVQNQESSLWSWTKWAGESAVAVTKKVFGQ